MISRRVKSLCDWHSKHNSSQRPLASQSVNLLVTSFSCTDIPASQSVNLLVTSFSCTDIPASQSVNLLVTSFSCTDIPAYMSYKCSMLLLCDRNTDKFASWRSTYCITVLMYWCFNTVDILQSLYWSAAACLCLGFEVLVILPASYG